VFVPHKSILDLLDQFQSCALPFEVFLDLLPPLRPRYYSISSSPLVALDTCSLTVGVLETPAHSGQGRFKGICSNYLAGLPIDATVFGFVCKSTIPFRPPDIPHVPMIMVGPSTGVAPFRGFLQERAALKQRGVPVAESMLFFGCRDPLQDIFLTHLIQHSAGLSREDQGSVSLFALRCPLVLIIDQVIRFQNETYLRLGARFRSPAHVTDRKSEGDLPYFAFQRAVFTFKCRAPCRRHNVARCKVLDISAIPARQIYNFSIY
jgi:FAD binding domain